jgi:hypothetical protein
MRKAFFIACALLLAGCGNPKSAEIDVPFTSQAPQGNWSQPWQDACEETSIYMVSSFYADDPIKREEAVKRIREILKVKNETIKVSYDESLETIAKLIDTLGLPWTTELKIDPSADDLKTELAAGRPIIVPVYEPALKNPLYSAEYHVLVLTGYDDEKDEFIVNDPGTKSGDGLRFQQDLFMAAIHDLNPQDKDAGRKAVLYTRQDDWREWFESLSP